MKLRKIAVLILVAALLLSILLPVVSYADAPPTGVSRTEQDEVPEEDGAESNSTGTVDDRGEQAEGPEEDREESNSAAQESERTESTVKPELDTNVEEQEQQQPEGELEGTSPSIPIAELPEASDISEEIQSSERSEDTSQMEPDESKEESVEQESQEPEVETLPWYDDVRILTIMIWILTAVIVILLFVIWKLSRF